MNNRNVDFSIPKWNQLPDVDLYIDQVLSIVNQSLPYYTNNNEHVVLTKTMINNYVKARIVPPPIKKKYSKSSIAYLFVISTLKPLFNVTEIAELIRLTLESHELSSSYDEYCSFLDTAIYQINNGEAIHRGNDSDGVINAMEDAAIAVVCQINLRNRLNKKQENS